MAYMVTEDCIACGSCHIECPNEAISDGERISVIDQEKCTECVGAHEASQCSAVCPQDACVPDPKYKENHEQLLEKWKKLHPGETPSYI
jgi:ferredoxin